LEVVGSTGSAAEEEKADAVQQGLSGLARSAAASEMRWCGRQLRVAQAETPNRRVVMERKAACSERCA
jgi:hypothetical protein